MQAAPEDIMDIFRFAMVITWAYAIQSPHCFYDWAKIRNATISANGTQQKADVKITTEEIWTWNSLMSSTQTLLSLLSFDGRYFDLSHIIGVALVKFRLLLHVMALQNSILSRAKVECLMSFWTPFVDNLLARSWPNTWMSLKAKM